MMESKEKGKRDENGDELVLVEAATDGGDDDEDATAQEKMKQNGGHQHSRGQSSDPAGDLKVNHHNSSSSQMLGLLDEFTKIYSDRLQRVEQTAMKTTDKQYLESKVCVLESWVRDLGEQNAVLVATVEELEKEAADRVALLEDRLAKMAVTTRESCVSLRDHQMQVSSLVADKIGLEKETHGLFDKLVRLEKGNLRLKEENNNLTSDLNNLVQIISRARVTGQWEADDLTFSCVTPEQVFGPVLSSSRRSSQSLKDSQRDYIHQMLEDHIKKDNSSIRSSLSNLQDADSGSIYGSRGSEKDMIIMKLKSELRCSQTAHEEVNCQVVERDKQIADLQAQLTEIHHELAESQAEVSRVTHALTELRHQNRHESIEVSSRKEEVIRHLLCKASSKRDNIKGSFPSLCDLDTAGTSDNNIEAQLSENIDILAGRLAELEDECQQMRDQHSVLQDTHSLCAPTINMLQDQLSRSQQSMLTPVEEEVVSSCKQETKSTETQTYQIDSLDKGAMTEQCSIASPPNGFYPNSPQFSQVSKLHNEAENKNEVLQKIESENASLTKMLNEKSATLEKYQNDVLRMSSDLDKRRREVTDQRLTISSLQDALVASKRTCDDLRMRLESDVSDGMLHHSLPPQILASCNHNLQSMNPSVNKSISSSSLAFDPQSETARACCDSSIVLVSHPSTTTTTTTTTMNLTSANNNNSDVSSNGSLLSNGSFSTLQMVDSHGLISAATDNGSDKLPDMRTTYSELCANNVNQSASSAIDVGALPALNGSSSFLSNTSICQGKQVNGDIHQGTGQIIKQVVPNTGSAIVNGNGVKPVHPPFTGQVFDV